MPQWGALLAAAAALLVWPGAGWRRLPIRQRETPRVRAGTARIRRCAVGGVGVAGAAALIWPTAFLGAVAAGTSAAIVLWYSGAGPDVAQQRQERAQLAMLCELWAAALECGLPVGGALRAAVEANSASMPGASVARLARVAGLLQLGVDAARSWTPVDDDPLLAPIGVAARRSCVSGAELAAMVREQAKVIRRAETAAEQRRAGRAGVLMTAPLALCFLPSFICLGLAPVVVALINTLEIGR